MGSAALEVSVPGGQLRGLIPTATLPGAAEDDELLTVLTQRPSGSKAKLTSDAASQ